jgi:1,4-dihydroxy-2-naphthoate polyprenyltransferase
MPSSRSANPTSRSSRDSRDGRVNASTLPVRTGSWRAWIIAARPPTLPAAIVPVVVGTASVATLSTFRPLPFLAALLAALLIQIGTNFANDVFDYHKGADTIHRLGPTRVTQSGLIRPQQVLVATFVTFGLSAVVGLYLIYVGGWPILAIGVLSIASGLAYTGGPWPLGYNGLGDLFVFVFFGVVAVVGSAYLQTGAFELVALVASIPVGLLVTAILVVNNLRDVDTDRVAGKKTLAVRFGRRATRWQYGLFVAIAYAVPLLQWLTGTLGWLFWLPWLTLPLAIVLIRTIATRSDGPTLNRALKRTGQLHLLFGLLYAASLLT